MLCFYQLSLAYAQESLGVASCASSNCHGSVTGKESTNILQNEYVTWKRHDSHAKAWEVLNSPDSKIIGKHLGIDHPESSNLCLSCHATTAKDKGEKFRVEDGVGCESCHGAASGWIKTHTETGATHAENIKNGMQDIVNPQLRSNSCLSCHLGSNQSEVKHKLIGAGHPRLTFELETFSEIQPRHWKQDSDYKQRKGPHNASQSWLIGQISRSLGFLELFLKSTEKDLIPDFTFFNCYSCHHSLKENQWKNHNYHGAPGKLNLNTSSLTLISLATENKALTQLITQLQKADSRDELINSTKETIKFLKSFSNTEFDSKKAISNIKKYSLENPTPQYELAEQIIMAINVLSGKNSDEFKSVYKALEDEKSFNAIRFSEAIKKLR